MLKIKIFVLFGIILISSRNIPAQNKSLDNYRCALLESYIKGDLTAWSSIISEMQNSKNNDILWQTEILKAYYGLVGFQLTFKKYDDAELNIEKASEMLEKQLIRFPRNAVFNSLTGAFKGYEITVSFYKAPFIGSSSLKFINKGLSLDSKEPICYIVKGNSLLFRSAAFGGNKNEALNCFYEALKLDKNTIQEKCNWQRLLNCTFIIKGLIETNQEIKAKEFLKQVENEFGKLEWINKFVGANIVNKQI